MKLQFIVILLIIAGITTGLAQVGDEYITITVTSEGKAKISQTLFPKTFVSTIDAHVISEKISNLLAIDEKNILLGTTQNKELLKIATLGASSVDLKYNADILTYESGVFKLKYNSDIESRVSLPPLSKLVSLNTIPIDITDKEYILPPGDISLSYSIRPVTSHEFVVPVGDSDYIIEAITAAKIEEFSANRDEIQFIIKDKAIILTMIPKIIMKNPNDAVLNGEKVDFTQFHQNATHSWIRIEPHEKGLIRILDTTEKSEGGGCLIATAAYGSELAPQVQVLREIRDNQLMHTESGASFMTGFNQLYYSFSPTVADIERENPAFKEMVKIVITPLLSSLSIMTFAESEHEIVVFGIGVILMNIGMYLVLPFVICYQSMRIIRTRRTNESKRVVITSHGVLSVMRKSLFGIIALLVLSVSISSAFQSAYAAEDDPIRRVLDITYQNIQDSRNSLDEIPASSQTFFEAGEEKYNEAIAALDAGDITTAKESALVAMALFENAAEEIGALEDQASVKLPPGFGSAIDRASDTGITQGQGSGVAGVPPGILKQITAANTFEIQEQITEIDKEIEGLQNLIESSNLAVNLEKVNESVNLAKEVLMSGDIPNAQAKLAVAKEIKDELYEQINQAVKDNEDERIQQFVDNSINNINEMLEKDNLGLTKKAINELQDTLAVLESGDVDKILDKTNDNSEFAKEVKSKDSGNSGNAPGQDEAGPGNSENAPGQNKDESDLPPGSGAAGDNPSENAKGQGLGLGNIPPGQLKKLNDYSGSFEQSADDFYENSYEASIDDIFEANYDGTNKGNGDGKGMFGAFPGKTGIAPGSLNADIKSNGKKPFCAGKGIGGIPVILLNGPSFVSIANGGTYTESGARACDVGQSEITDLIVIGGTVNTSVDGIYTITYDVTSPKPAGQSANTVSRTVIVGEINPIFEVLDMNGVIHTSDFATQVDIGAPHNDDTYSVGIIQNIFDNTGTDGGVITDSSAIDNTVPVIGVYTIAYTVTDDDSNTVSITETVTVCDGGCATEPAQVTGLTANAVSSSQIDLTWTAPSDGGSPITGYMIEQKATGPWTTIIADTGNTNTSYSVTGLTASTTYQYRVSAINSVGPGSASAFASDTTFGGGAVPGKPTNVSGSAASSTLINISWTAPADDGGSPITGYQIERNILPGNNWTIIVTDTGNTNEVYSDNSVSAGNDYRYRISAINAIGVGQASTQSSTITTP